jgi:DNA polymerase III subunit alpha
MVPIHNHTHYSALDGLSKPSEIVERIQSIGLGACGITDHDVVTGHYDFYNTMTEAGLKPILGIEAYQTFGARQVNKGFRTDPKTKDRADNFHLIMLGMNDVGLRNL